MKMEKADGPKTELVGVSQQMQQSIEEMIASVSRGIGDCMENARNAQPRSLADNTRSSERNDAVHMMSSTAELLGSIAKLKGEFRHNYQVTRMNEPQRTARPTVKCGWNGDESQLLTQAEYDALSEWEQIDYDRWTDGLPPRFDGWKRPKPEQKNDVADEPIQSFPERTAQTETPLPKNAGSNTDAGNS